MNRKKRQEEKQAKDMLGCSFMPERITKKSDKKFKAASERSAE